MCQWGVDRNPWAGYRMGPSPTPYVSLNPQTGGDRKIPPFKFQPTGRRLTMMSIEHIFVLVGAGKIVHTEFN